MQAIPHRIVERVRGAGSGPGAVLAAEVLLVCAIAAVTAVLTWRLMPARDSVMSTAVQPVDPQAHTGADGARIELASLHLFGRASTQTRAAPEAVPEDVPETRLNLRLQGVFATGDGNGLAIILVGNGDESVFTPGDRVAGQANVKGVYADRVILERDGALETLRLTTDEVETRNTTRETSGSREVQRIARKARELRARLMKNPLELARMVRFQPYLRDGELVGYRIQPRADYARLLSELGLEPTDVITAVNGVELSDPAKAQQALRQIRDADTITVSWLRDGEQRRMTIPIGSSS